MINKNQLVDSNGHLTDRALLLLLDAELPSRRASELQVHVARCASCQSRVERLERLDDLRAAAPDVSAAHVRARLQARLVEAASSKPRPRFAAARRWAYAAAAGVAVWVAAQTFHRADRVEAAALPVPALTPGAVDQTAAQELCAGGLRRRPRTVSRDVRQRVLESYRMTDVSPSEYELDYLITPELGGASDGRNLWPQRHSSATWNARVKDDLEALLPRLVCAGQVDLRSAQRDIARNWIAAYRKYFHTEDPLPTTHGGEADDDDIQIVEVERIDASRNLAGVSFQGEPRVQTPDCCGSIRLLPLAFSIIGPAARSAVQD